MQHVLTGCCVPDIFPQISDGRQSTHIGKKNWEKKITGVSIHVKVKTQYIFYILHTLSQLLWLKHLKSKINGV